jgi:hypothetical protein
MQRASRLPLSPRHKTPSHSQGKGIFTFLNVPNTAIELFAIWLG